MSKLGLALIATCLISTASVAQQDLAFDTFRLISWCRQPDGTHNRGFCLGYVAAMATAIAHEYMALKVGDSPLPANERAVCIPNEVRAGQLAGCSCYSRTNILNCCTSIQISWFPKQSQRHSLVRQGDQSNG
jgi:hypothetical protein